MPCAEEVFPPLPLHPLLLAPQSSSWFREGQVGKEKDGEGKLISLVHFLRPSPTGGAPWAPLNISLVGREGTLPTTAKAADPRPPYLHRQQGTWIWASKLI